MYKGVLWYLYIIVFKRSTPFKSCHMTLLRIVYIHFNTIIYKFNIKIKPYYFIKFIYNGLRLYQADSSCTPLKFTVVFANKTYSTIVFVLYMIALILYF